MGAIYFLVPALTKYVYSFVQSGIEIALSKSLSLFLDGKTAEKIAFYVSHAIVAIITIAMISYVAYYVVQLLLHYVSALITYYSGGVVVATLSETFTKMMMMEKMLIGTSFTTTIFGGYFKIISESKYHHTGLLTDDRCKVKEYYDENAYCKDYEKQAKLKYEEMLKFESEEHQKMKTEVGYKPANVWRTTDWGVENPCIILIFKFRG